ncbi:hypothetical protein RB195_000100 [Necator americanus]|uniref:Uncharacterized protein n=1 Tax=Necator americanus TaxID=51031 RepID=A0ABR1D9E5_NECAM
MAGRLRSNEREVELEVLKKPFRQWTAEEVTGVLNGVITQDEEQRMLHNDIKGCVVKDFCCVDFLIYVLHLSKSTAIKVMEVLQPYMDEYEDEEVVLTDYCFQSRVLFTEGDTLPGVAESNSKYARTPRLRNPDGDSRKFLSTTLETYYSEDPSNGEAEIHNFTDKTYRQPKDLHNFHKKTSSIRSCATQSNEYTYNK